jgi:hypothetical protein
MKKILLFGICILFLINSVSAIELPDREPDESYTKNNIKVDWYNTINGFGYMEYIYSVELIEGSPKELDIETFIDNAKPSIYEISEFTIYELEEKTRNVDDVKYICNQVIDGNGTYYEKCGKEVVGSHEEIYQFWDENLANKIYDRTWLNWITLGWLDKMDTKLKKDYTNKRISTEKKWFKVNYRTPITEKDDNNYGSVGRIGIMINGIIYHPWYDTALQYRRVINVTNNEAFSTLGNFTANLSLDTASLITAGKMQSDCGDLRIVYHEAGVDVSSGVELDRILYTQCNQENTTLHFKLQAPTAGSSTNDTAYYMYYGNTTMDNPTRSSGRNGSKVYFAYDDFEEDRIIFRDSDNFRFDPDNDWTTLVTSSGDWEVENGLMNVTSTATGIIYFNKSLGGNADNGWDWYNPINMTVEIYSTKLENRLIIGGLNATNAGYNDGIQFYYGVTQYNFLGIPNSLTYGSNTSGFDSNQPIRRHRISRYSYNSSLYNMTGWYKNATMTNFAPIDLLTYPTTNHSYFLFNTTYLGMRESGSTNSYDNFTVKLYTENMPSFTLSGGEEVSVPTHTNPILNTTLGTNLTEQNLTCWNQSTEGYGNDVKNIYSWYLQNYTMEVLNLPFEGDNNISSVLDYSGFGNDVNVSGATYLSTSGYDGYGAYSFDGNNDYMEFVGSPSLNISEDEITISFWVNVSTVANSGLITKRDSASSNNAYSVLIDSSNDFSFEITHNGGTRVVVEDNLGSITTKTKWYYITGVYNSTAILLYIDGVLQDSTATTGNIFPSSIPLRIGSINDPPAGFFQGDIDDVRIYNRSLSAEQVVMLNNSQSWKVSSGDTSNNEVYICAVTPISSSGAGSTLNSSALRIVANDAPIINNITIHPNQTNQYYDNISINCSSNIDVDNAISILNFIWYKNGVMNNSLNSTIDPALDGTYFSQYNLTGNLKEIGSNYTCGIIINDQYNPIQFANSTTAFINSSLYDPNIIPSITNATQDINGSMQYQGEGLGTVIFSWFKNAVLILSTTYDNIVSGTWISEIFSSGNYTTGDNITLNITINNTGENIILYANVTSNFTFSEVTYYDSPIIEGTTTTIATNITHSSEGNITDVDLIYDNVTYQAVLSIINNNIQYWNISLITPLQRNASYFNWNMTFTYDGNILYNMSQTYQQNYSTLNGTISINETNCNDGLTPTMCWDFGDEQNLTNLTADSVDYNFEYGSSETPYEIFGQVNDTNSFCLCINSTLYNNYTLGYGELQYKKLGFADRRFYTFSANRLTNQTINNTLYFLENGEATSFLFEFKDTSLKSYIGNYTTLLRWYPNLNQYIIVDMGKTDDKGETIMRVEVEDVDYRVGLYHTDGTLVKLLNPVRFACLSSPCSYASVIEEVPSDYTSVFDVEGSIVYNETTEIWTYVWNDPTQNTEEMRFVVQKETPTSIINICNVSASGFTGILTCNSTDYTGILRGIGYRSASPEIPFLEALQDVRNTVFRGTMGLFLSFLVFLTLTLIGIVSPIIAIVLGICALIFSYFIGSISLPIFTALAVVGGITIHFMKRV